MSAARRAWAWCVQLGGEVVQGWGEWWRRLPEWVREVVVIEALAVAWLAWMLSAFLLIEGFWG